MRISHLKTPVLSIAIASISLAAVPGIASAACNGGEICYYQNDNGGGGEYKTIKRSFSHTNINFNNGVALRDNADSVKNRDTNCDIKVIDDRGWYPDDVDTIPNDGLLRNLKGAVDNENDRSEVGSC